MPGRLYLIGFHTYSTADRGLDSNDPPLYQITFMRNVQAAPRLYDYAEEDKKDWVTICDSIGREQNS